MGRYVLNIVILHNSLKNIGLRLSVSICGAIMYGMPWNELGKIISLWNFALDVFISCKKNCSSLLYTFHVLQLHIVWESLRNTSRGAVVQIFVTEKLYDEVLGMSFDFYNCVVLLFLACGQVLGFIWFKLTHLRLKTSRVLGLSIKLTYLTYKLNSDDYTTSLIVCWMQHPLCIYYKNWTISIYYHLTFDWNLDN